MGELEDRLNSLLADPGQMERLAGLARSLMGAEAEAAAPEAPDSSLLRRVGALMAQESGAPSREQALLRAMEPWLSPRRRTKLENALRLARVARLARLAMGEAGGEGDDQSV